MTHSRLALTILAATLIIVPLQAQAQSDHDGYVEVAQFYNEHGDRRHYSKHKIKKRMRHLRHRIRHLERELAQLEHELSDHRHKRRHHSGKRKEHHSKRQRHEHGRPVVFGKVWINF